MRLSALLALSALAALAIAPAHAMAVAENPSAGQCHAPRAGDPVTWIGGQLCAVEQGSGGGTGLGTGPGALPGVRTQPGEVVWVTGEIPVCLRNPSRCLSHEFGGRGGQEIKDGPGSGGPRGGGKGSTEVGRKAGTAKGKNPTLSECQALDKDQYFWEVLPQFKARAAQIEASRLRFSKRKSAWYGRRDELKGKVRLLEWSLDGYRAEPDPRYIDTVMGMEGNLANTLNELGRLEAQIKKASQEGDADSLELFRMRQESRDLRRPLLERCHELYGQDLGNGPQAD
jgi:hypothetical protein